MVLGGEHQNDYILHDSSGEQQADSTNKAKSPPPPPPTTPPRSRSYKRRRVEGDGIFRSVDKAFRSPDSTDDMSSKSGGPSWRQRISWMRDNHPATEPDEQYEYADSTMEDPSLVLTASPSQKSLKRDSSLKRESVFARSLSYLSKRSSGKNTDDDSVGDFEESEWTPQDSAYGAACPICGCLPKNMRRGIEISLIGLMVLFLIFLIVAISMKINNEREINRMHNNTNNDDVGVNLDDDYYIDYTDDDDYYINNDDGDDYFDDDDVTGGANDDAADDAAVDDDSDDYYRADYDDDGANRVRNLDSGEDSSLFNRPFRKE